MGKQNKKLGERASKFQITEATFPFGWLLEPAQDWIVFLLITAVELVPVGWGPS
jgi:hypothetical protein